MRVKAKLWVGDTYLDGVDFDVCYKIPGKIFYRHINIYRYDKVFSELKEEEFWDKIEAFIDREEELILKEVIDVVVQHIENRADKKQSVSIKNNKIKNITKNVNSMKFKFEVK